jgi:hypothetical protein
MYIGLEWVYCYDESDPGFFDPELALKAPQKPSDGQDGPEPSLDAQTPQPEAEAEISRLNGSGGEEPQKGWTQRPIVSSKGWLSMAVVVRCPPGANQSATLERIRRSVQDICAGTGGRYAFDYVTRKFFTFFTVDERMPGGVVAQTSKMLGRIFQTVGTQLAGHQIPPPGMRGEYEN